MATAPGKHRGQGELSPDIPEEVAAEHGRVVAGGDAIAARPVTPEPVEDSGKGTLQAGRFHEGEDWLYGSGGWPVISARASSRFASRLIKRPTRCLAR